MQWCGGGSDTRFAHRLALLALRAAQISPVPQNPAAKINTPYRFCPLRRGFESLYLEAPQKRHPQGVPFL